MGLDVYASRTWQQDGDDLTRADRRAFQRAKIDIGQYSQPGSFWGTDCWRLVSLVCPAAGFDDEIGLPGLFWINPTTVREIADAFERCDDEAIAVTATSDVAYRLSPREFTPEHVEGFRRFFRVCVRRKLGLIYWH